MNDSPLISIIIPTYNRAHLIGETLDSVLAQTYENWECIIVDDGSSDNTDEVVDVYAKKDSRFKYCHRKSLPKGASHCRNIGLEKAEGVYCIFLDSDDLLLNFCLAKRLEDIQHCPDNYFWVFPMFSQKNQQKLQTCYIPKKESYIEDFLSCRIHWGVMCTLWKSDFLKSINGFNIFYPRLNDPETHIRAMLEAKTKYFVFSDNDPDSIHRLTAGSKGKTEFAMKYYQSLTLFIPDISRKLTEYDNKNQIHLLKGYLKNYIKIALSGNTRQNNVKLLKFFYENYILSYYQYKSLIVLYYLSLLLNKLKKKINKIMHNLL